MSRCLFQKEGWCGPKWHVCDQLWSFVSRMWADAQYEHVTPCLLRLHWLPVRRRVQFKLCCIMHSVSYGTSPAYLTNIVEPAGAGRTRSGLRSTSLTDYTLPRLRTKFAERAFSYTGPSAWNGLSEDLRAVADPAEFQKQLKTHFFTAAYNVGSRPSDHYFRSVCWFVCLSVCLFVCLCRVFLSRLWSDFDQTRTYVICLGLVVSRRI